MEKIIKNGLKPLSEVELIKPLITDGYCYCPICYNEFSESSYLKKVFSDEKEKWLANMITHYSHDHIRWWNRAGAEVDPTTEMAGLEIMIWKKLK